MARQDIIELNYWSIRHLYYINDGVLALWAQSSNLPKRAARKDLVSFATNLPIHQRRKESLGDYITRKLLEQISVRFAALLNPPVVEEEVLPETVTITAMDIQEDVWEVVSGQMGGFSKCPDGIVGKPWDIDGESCLVYRLHQEYVDPRLRIPRHPHWDTYRCLHVDHLGVSVYVEFNLLVIADVVIVGIVQRAIERKYRSYMG